MIDWTDKTFIENETRRRWEANEFYERRPGTPYFKEYNPTDSMPYETYMRAWRDPLFPNVLRVEFPADSAEDNRLHTHPDSDRVVIVLRGSGTFIAVRNDKRIEMAIAPSDRIWMPRSVLHTFKAGPEGLLVNSVHNPYIPIDDARCLVYPE